MINRRFLSVAALAMLSSLTLVPAISPAQNSIRRSALPDAKELESAEEPGYLGITLAEVTPSAAERLDVPDGEGVLVMEVLEDSPAAKAGLEPNDVIVSIGRQEVRSPEQLSRLIGKMKSGADVDITYYRNGKEKSGKATLAPRPATPPRTMFTQPGGFNGGTLQIPNVFQNGNFDFFGSNGRVRVAPGLGGSDPAQVDEMRAAIDEMQKRLDEMKEQFAQQSTDDDSNGPQLAPGEQKAEDDQKSPVLDQGAALQPPRRLGVALQPLSDQLGEFFGAKAGEGVLVATVEKGSFADKAGLKAGDVVLQIGGKSVGDPDSASRLVRQSKDDILSIDLLRQKQKMSFNVKMK